MFIFKELLLYLQNSKYFFFLEINVKNVFEFEFEKLLSVYHNVDKATEFCDKALKPLSIIL